MIITSACPYKPQGKNAKAYEPFTVQRNKNGTYTCGVKGGYCIDITYYDPGLAKLYENNSTFCHSRDCAKLRKRFRGCVASDDFIQQVYIQKKKKIGGTPTTGAWSVIVRFDFDQGFHL